MRKAFYFIAAIMALETAGIGFSKYMNGRNEAMVNLDKETICQSSSDSLIQPENQSLGIRHVTSDHNLD